MFLTLRILEYHKIVYIQNKSFPNSDNLAQRKEHWWFTVLCLSTTQTPSNYFLLRIRGKVNIFAPISDDYLSLDLEKKTLFFKK